MAGSAKSHVVSSDFVLFERNLLHPAISVKMVVGGGFEPPKALPTDLQSVPFDRSGTPPCRVFPIGSPTLGSDGARDRNRTRDRLITNQLLYRLSYSGPDGRRQASGSGRNRSLPHRISFFNCASPKKQEKNFIEAQNCFFCPCHGIAQTASRRFRRLDHGLPSLDRRLQVV